MRRLIYIVFLAATLQACASPQTTLPTPEALAGFNQGSSSIIIINAAGAPSCDSTIFVIHREGAQTNQVAWTLREAGYATSAPAILVVPPSKYHVTGATCLRSGYYLVELLGLGAWFGKVEVKSGDVVYLGTLDAELLDFRTAMSSGLKFLNALLFSSNNATDT